MAPRATRASYCPGAFLAEEEEGGGGGGEGRWQGGEEQAGRLCQFTYATSHSIGADLHLIVCRWLVKFNVEAFHFVASRGHSSSSPSALKPARIRSRRHFAHSFLGLPGLLRNVVMADCTDPGTNVIFLNTSSSSCKVYDWLFPVPSGLPHATNTNAVCS